MTLICATVTDEVVFIIGDTLLTPLLEIKGNPTGEVNGEFHGLKIQILNAHTAVAFTTSNSTHAALSAIAELSKRLQKNVGIDAFGELLAIYQGDVAQATDEKPNCEFLVLQINASGRQLAHITAAGIRRCERAYIGDAEEYALLAKLRQPFPMPTHEMVQQPDGSFREEPVPNAKGQAEFMEMIFALEALVNQRRSKSGGSVGAIGGNIIRVGLSRTSGELEYLQSAMISTSPEEGRAGYSLLASNEGTRGIAIYYRVGQVGFIMVAGDEEMCRREVAESIAEFIENAKQKYGLNLVGPTWN